MSVQWLTTMKPSFQIEWLALPPKEVYQVLEKINLLSENPMPDGDVKRQIKGKGKKAYRIRCGDYRIIYTFEKPYVSILALRRRSEDTYDEDFDIELLGGLDPEFWNAPKVTQPDWERVLAPKESEKRRLPEPITQELLTNLHVPREYYTRLLLVQTEEDLLDCPGVPEDILLKVDEFMFERPLAQVLQQPDYLLNDIEDLLRFKAGELLGFLLRLSPEQEKFVNWAVNASGPTLVKGGPGTGKSTVALYRVRSLIQNLRGMGQDDPCILFTTYTNALVRSSEQLLRQLLGEDARHVEVQTADKKVSDILRRAGTPQKTTRDNTMLRKLFQQALIQTQFEGSLSQQRVQQQSLERLGYEYLQDEINQVIVARQITTLEDYMNTRRPGRKVRLGEAQKKAIWRIHETFLQILKGAGLETWYQARARAESIVTNDYEFQSYDAVVVDEAQDLDPSVLRLLIKLCKAPNRFFITADANQSIYGNGFNWTDVHESLKFRGRTSVLRANYRSTGEIGEAAQSYLLTGMLDAEPVERIYVNSGPMPAVRTVRGDNDEVQLLVRFLQRAAYEFRLGIGSCAVLCPTKETGKSIAAGLVAYGVEASFMEGRELDLSQRGVKVLTLNSSKGLEFPIVALAGFIGSRYANASCNASNEEQEEELARERRTIFVGMTRAMRALLVIVPTQTQSPLLTDFDAVYWNIGE